MALKIELEKAYDRLSCDFIRDILMDMGLNSDWIRNTRACIESPIIAILWNGDQLDWFKLSKGVQQGDSISPYITVLCVGQLNHIIGQAIENSD